MPTSENAEMAALRQKIRELTEQKRAGGKEARMVREMDKLLMRMEIEKLATTVQHRERARDKDANEAGAGEGEGGGRQERAGDEGQG
jgi:hypothetical protein